MDGAPLGSAAFTVIPRCSPLNLVRLWCGPLLRYVMPPPRMAPRASRRYVDRRLAVDK